MNAVHWREDYPAVRGVVHLAMLLGAALDQGHRGRGGVGAGHRPRDARSPRAWARIHTRPAHPARAWRGTWTARCSWSRATATRSRRPATAARWPASAAGGSRWSAAPATSRTPASRSRSTWRCATSPRTPSGRRARRATPPSTAPTAVPRALYISSPIGLGHAQRDVAIARELRRLQPDLQIDWLAQDPVTRVLEGGGRAHPPRQRPSGQRVAPHRVGVRRARPALLPGAAPHGRDPRRQLHALPRRRARRALRPVDRRRGLGARLLPAREPAREARPVRLADRLRRLPADGRTEASGRAS